VEELSAPMELDTDYLLTIRRNGGTAGANDFYFLLHYGGGSNPLETEDNNDTLATAQALTFEKDTTNAFVEGDLGAGDVDYFSVDVPATGKKVSLFCGARTSGSGLQDLRAALVGADDSDISGGTAVETATKGIEVKDVAVPQGASKLYLRLNAMGQVPGVTGSYYRCGVIFTE
jgi:hypothetical protein